MKVLPDRLLIPVKLGETQKEFAFQPGYAWSSVSEDTVKELSLRVRSIGSNVSIGRGPTRIRDLTRIPSFMVGDIEFKDMELLVLPPAANPEGYSGDIGMRPFSKADIELDMAQGKLNLFSQDHCPGSVVYWTKGGSAQLPFEWQDIGYIRPQMQLDGKPVTTIFTGNGHSYIGMNKMRVLFGLDSNSPGMTPTGTNELGQRTFRYPFKELAAAGLTISNPAITVYDEPPVKGCIYRLHFEDPARVPFPSTEQPHLATCSGGGDISLGVSVLSKLHIYAALKEKILYLTPAEAR